MLLGESFYEAAVRKAKKETGLEVSACAVLGTWNSIFERSAWRGGARSQTVNVLVHATTDDPRAADLRICGGPQHSHAARGKCAELKWVSTEESSGEDIYILEGFARLRARGQGEAACDARTVASPVYAALS